MIVSPIEQLQVTWEKLPDDYVLPDEPVDNINQPLLAAALTEILQINNRLPATALTPTNYGICATVNGQTVVKAPDWAYIPNIRVPRKEVERSYTPQLQGDMPVIVIEFVSDTEGNEYSVKPTHPPGKWYFYERILKVNSYVIFQPSRGEVEFYSLDASGKYIIQDADQNNRYWVPQMNLFLGVWEGIKENRSGYWLRWWDEEGNLLLWGSEMVELERQRTEQERQRASRFAEQLRAMGVEPEI
jgi:Uma2 family endonuclease